MGVRAIENGDIPKNEAVMYNDDILMQHVKWTITTSKNNMYASLRLLLCFGKVVGFLPISGLFSGRTLENLSVRRGSLFGAAPLFVIFTLVLQLGTTFYVWLENDLGDDPLAIAQSFRPLVFAAAGLYFVIFLYTNCNELLDILREWYGMKILYGKEDSNMPIIVNIIVAFLIISGVAENSTSHIGVVIVNGQEMPMGLNTSLWETYWRVHYQTTVHSLSCSKSIILLLSLANAWTVSAWNVSGILVSVVAIVIYRRLKLQNEAMLEALASCEIKSSKTTWIEFVNDHRKVAKLLNRFNELLSPLIFVLIFTDMYNMGMFLSYFFLPKASSDKESVFWKKLFITWTFVHLVVRSFGTLICAGRVHMHAHNFSDVLDKCPVACLSKEVEREERKLGTFTMGFSGLGLFIITKSFILTALNVLVTFEIVLLQSSSTGATKV